MNPSSIHLISKFSDLLINIPLVKILSDCLRKLTTHTSEVDVLGIGQDTVPHPVLYMFEKSSPVLATRTWKPTHFAEQRLHS